MIEYKHMTIQEGLKDGARNYFDAITEGVNASVEVVTHDRKLSKPDGSLPEMKIISDEIDELARMFVLDDKLPKFSALQEKPPKNIKTDEVPDIAIPMFHIAKSLKMSPVAAASKVTENIKLSQAFKHVDHLGPYVNLRLNDELIVQGISQITKLDHIYGMSDMHSGKVAVIDFSGPNVAKPFGVNHLRSTVIGESLSRIFEASGYTVVRDNHLGDWGTQFGNLLAAYDAYQPNKAFEDLTIDELNALYVKFSTEKKDSPQLVRKGREAFAKLDSKGDPESLARWANVVTMSTSDFDEMYGRLGIKFDTKIGESYFVDSANILVEQLAENYPDIVKKDEASQAVYIDDGEHPVVLRTADGYCVYAARDLATIDFRSKTYSPDAIVYVVGEEQASSFRTVFKVATDAGLVRGETTDTKRILEYIGFGMLLDDKGKKLSTRSGTSGKLATVLDEVTDRARQEVGRRNPEMDEDELLRIAGKIAIGAIIWNDLKNDRVSSVRFDIERMLKLGGETVIDVLYSYARSRSVIENANLSKAIGDASVELKALPTQIEHELGYALFEFPDVVRKALEDRAPHHIASYLQSLVRLHGSFYEVARVKDEPDRDLQLARALLHKAYMIVIRNGLGLLNISVPDKL